jgi:FixJ family two-component response regulator
MANILLIDDDKQLRQDLENALKSRGHQVRCLDRAEGGVDVLAVGEFDLVLVDERLPGMPGSEFLKLLRKERLRIPAILITGQAIGALCQSMKDLGVHVVGKPRGGNDEFWKDLEPVLDEALAGETEIIESIGRAVAVTLRAGKTNVTAYLRNLLYQELRTRVRAEAKDDEEKAMHILGVPLGDLEELPELSLQTRALMLIFERPELTVAQYVKQLRCPRIKLYRDEKIKAALQSRNGGYRGPRGYKTADGDLEAYDE